MNRQIVRTNSKAPALTNRNILEQSASKAVKPTRSSSTVPMSEIPLPSNTASLPPPVSKPPLNKPTIQPQTKPAKEVTKEKAEHPTQNKTASSQSAVPVSKTKAPPPVEAAPKVITSSDVAKKPVTKPVAVKKPVTKTPQGPKSSVVPGNQTIPKENTTSLKAKTSNKKAGAAAIKNVSKVGVSKGVVAKPAALKAKSQMSKATLKKLKSLKKGGVVAKPVVDLTASQIRELSKLQNEAVRLKHFPNLVKTVIIPPFGSEESESSDDEEVIKKKLGDKFASSLDDFMKQVRKEVPAVLAEKSKPTAAPKAAKPSVKPASSKSLPSKDPKANNQNISQNVPPGKAQKIVGPKTSAKAPAVTVPAKAPQKPLPSSGGPQGKNPALLRMPSVSSLPPEKQKEYKLLKAKLLKMQKTKKMNLTATVGNLVKQPDPTAKVSKTTVSKPQAQVTAKPVKVPTKLDSDEKPKQGVATSEVKKPSLDDSEMDEDALRQTLLQAQAKKKLEDGSKSDVASMKEDDLRQTLLQAQDKKKLEDESKSDVASMKEDDLRQTLLLAKKKKEEEAKSKEALKGDKIVQSKEPVNKAKQTEPKVDKSIPSSSAASPKAVVSSVVKAKVEDPKIQQPQLTVKSKASTEFSGPVTKENPTAAELMDLITKEAELSKVRKTITRYEHHIKHLESSEPVQNILFSQFHFNQLN